MHFHFLPGIKTRENAVSEDVPGGWGPVSDPESRYPDCSSSYSVSKWIATTTRLIVLDKVSEPEAFDCFSALAVSNMIAFC